MESDSFNGSDEELVKLVEKFPQLYNKRDKSFKDKVFKENGWQSIASILNQPVGQCERRFLTLRNKYGTLKRKRSAATLSRSGCTEPIGWPLFSLMGFLDTFVVPRKKMVNVPQSTTLLVSPKNDSYEKIIIIPEANEIADTSFLHIKTDNVSEGSDRSSLTPTGNFTHRQKTGLRSGMGKMRKVTRDISAITELSKVTNELARLNKYLRESTKVYENDVEKSFANTMATVLKNMKGKRRRKRAMKELLSAALNYDSGSDTE